MHSVRKLSAQAIVCLEQGSGTPQPALCAPAFLPAWALPQFPHLFHVAVRTAVMSVSPEKGIVKTPEIFSFWEIHAPDTFLFIPETNSNEK